MRRLLALIAFVALAFAGAEAPALAAPVAAPAMEMASDCPGHAAAAEAVPAEQAPTAQPDCCADGCAGHCTMTALLAAPLPERMLLFERQTHRLPVPVAAPDRPGPQRERPPRSFA